MSDIQSIFSELLRQGGLPLSRINVQSVTGYVTGLAVNGRANLRSIVDELQTLFQLDAIESGGILTLKPRAGQAVASLTIDDLVPLREPRALFEITRQPDTALPEQVDVVYLDPASDYQRGTQTALRQVAPVTSTRQTLDANIAMNASIAKRLADVLLDTTWTERFTLTFAVSTKHAALEAGDIVDMTLHGTVWRVRLLKVVQRGTLLEITSVTTKAAAYAYTSNSDSLTTTQRVLIAQPSTLYALDLPIVDDQDDTAGFFTVVGRATDDAQWRTTTLYQSTDNISFDVDSIAFSTASHGVATSVLPLCPNPASWDRAGQVTVELIDGSLNSLPLLEVLNGSNIALLGGEIIQFADAHLIAPRTYTLRTLLRGRRGTEHAMAGHSSGERFILLDSSLSKRPIALDRIGQPLWLKGVSNGCLLENAIPVTFTPQAVSLKPLSPAQLRGRRDAAGSLLITWLPRTRYSGGWVDGRDVLPSEASEQYRVTIMDGSTIKRTITTTSPSYTYTDSQQISDFGSLQSSVSVQIAQVSALVGAGTPAITIV